MANIYSLTDAQCGDIAITAAEGGTGYWAQIDLYRWTDWQDRETGDPLPLSEGFAFYTMREMETDGLVFRVTPALIRKGWRKAVNEYRHAIDLADPSCTDATGADVIIQLGAFGTVIYG